MEYTINITNDELTPQLIDEIKRLLDEDKPLKITIIGKEKLLEESAEEYRTNLNRSIDDVENNRNLISFTPEQFEKFVNALSKK